MAYRRGDDTEDALAGAMLEAEHFAHTRLIAEFCVGIGGGRKKRRRG